MFHPPVQALVERYKNNLYAAAFSVCRRPQDAEDAAQETFIEYWSHNKDFESPAHLRAWLLRVAINKAKNKTNSFFRKNTLPLEEYTQTLTFETQEASELFEAVMALPENYRVPIHLFYYEDYSVAEIANILHLTEGSVKTRLSRGRKMLKNTLQEAWDDDE